MKTSNIYVECAIDNIQPLSVAFHLLLLLRPHQNTAAVKVICPLKWLPICALANVADAATTSEEAFKLLLT